MLHVSEFREKISKTMYIKIPLENNRVNIDKFLKLLGRWWRQWRAPNSGKSLIIGSRDFAISCCDVKTSCSAECETSWSLRHLYVVGRKGADKERLDMAAVSLVIPFRYVALFVLITFSFFAVNDGYCQPWTADCESNQVCCNHVCVSGSSCVGRSCSSDSQCSTGERCCGSRCTSDSSCAGHFCTSFSDCSRYEGCCNNVCKVDSGCIGYSCSTTSDCGASETCCYGTCQYTYDDCYDSTAVIIGSVVGGVVFISVISLFIFLVCRRRRTRHYGRMIEGQRTTATTLSTTGAIQSNPPHQGQVPPSHQQGYPYYPPLQYEQPQQATNIPPPYNPGTMPASEQPPPYPGEPQGGSGGVYDPKPFYGPMPSAPPV